MVTVTFNGTNITTAASGTVVMVVSSVSRPARKPMRRRRLTIPGRAGSWDFGNPVGEDYQVSVSGHIVAETSADVQATGLALAALLDGKHDLVVSDQPSVTHTAQVFSEIKLSPRPGRSRMVDIEITFDCDA